MRGLWIIARKDIVQRLRDRSAYVVGIVVPMALALLLGMVVSQEDDTYTFALYNQDRGPVADSFGDTLAGLEADGVATITPATSRSMADQLVEDNQVSAVFILPDGLSEAVAQGAPAELTVVANPSDEIGTQWALGVARAFTSNLDATNLAVATVAAVQGQAPDPAAVGSLTQAAASADQPARLVRGEGGGSGVAFTTHISFGMAVFFLFFAVQFGVLGLIDERTEGTMARLVAAPIPSWAILAGKALASLVIGILSVAVLVVGTSLPPLESDWGNLGGVALLTVAGVMAAVGVVALIGGLARTSTEAMGYMTFIAVLLGLLGGTFSPIGAAGSWLRWISRLTPHRWLVDGYRSLSVGRPLSEIVLPVVVLLLFAAVTGGLGLLRFRTQVSAP